MKLSNWVPYDVFYRYTEFGAILIRKFEPILTQSCPLGGNLAQNPQKMSALRNIIRTRCQFSLLRTENESLRFVGTMVCALALGNPFRTTFMTWETCMHETLIVGI